jgi:hypothetical protein
MKSGFLMTIGFKLQGNANEHFWFPNGSEKFSKKEYEKQLTVGAGRLNFVRVSVRGGTHFVFEMLLVW